MELLLAFIAGIVSTGIIELAKKLKVPARVMVAGIAALVAVVHIVLGMVLGEAEYLELLKRTAQVLAVWYATSTSIYEWLIKWFKPENK